MSDGRDEGGFPWYPGDPGPWAGPVRLNPLADIETAKRFTEAFKEPETEVPDITALVQSAIREITERRNRLAEEFCREHADKIGTHTLMRLSVSQDDRDFSSYYREGREVTHRETVAMVPNAVAEAMVGRTVDEAEIVNRYPSKTIAIGLIV